MGVSGCGKTTLGEAVSKMFDYKFLEGDHFHTHSNKKKMKNGIPLSDQDRLPWLKGINLALRNKLSDRIILSCSALKNSYRELINDQLPANSILWVHLNGKKSIIRNRIKNRTHFMPASLLESQFEDLEIPKEAISIDISLTIDEMIKKLKPYLNE